MGDGHDRKPDGPNNMAPNNLWPAGAGGWGHGGRRRARQQKNTEPEAQCKQKENEEEEDEEKETLNSTEFELRRVPAHPLL